jgi:membrane associated rhomboid family serine protease
VLLPIGHDKGVRRWPYVTVAVIVVCTLLQLYQSFGAPDEEELGELLFRRSQLAMEIMDDVSRREAEEAGVDLDDPDEEQLAIYHDILRRNEVLAEQLVAGHTEGVEHPRLPELAALDARIQAGLQGDLVVRWAFRTDEPTLAGLLLSMFVHAGWLHLVGNMLFFWLTGMSMEDRWGHLAFLAFYLLGGIAASLVYYAVHAGEVGGAVGASGAVAACMGAFLLCYWRVRVKLLWIAAVPFFMRTVTRVVHVRALYVLLAWIGEEILRAWAGDHGVAHSAHVGGFCFGLGVAAALRHTGQERRLVLGDELAEDYADENPEVAEARGYTRLGNKTAAIAAWEALLRRDPQQPEARRAICELALDVGEPDKARHHASAALVGMVRDGDASMAVVVYGQLVAAGAADQLSERALHDVVRAAIAIDRAPVAVQAVRQLLVDHPYSAFLPGLMFELASVQERHGRPELARRTLEGLVERFPVDAFADRARARLPHLPGGT